MAYYDYKVVVLPLSSGATEYMLCQLGDEGWDLIAVDFEARRYIFKKVRYHEINKTENQDSNDQGQRT